MSKEETLRSLRFGQRVAEEERDELVHYFVSTDLWTRVFSGDLDVVYGPKGSGKSAIYTLLNAKATELFDRGILLVAAENPRGTTAFRDLVPDPPASENEFRGLWKLYFATLIDGVFRDYGVKTPEAKTLRGLLADAGLVSPERSLSSALKIVADYARQAFRVEGVEGEIKVDPLTGLPAGFGGKVTFHEPSAAAREEGYRSVDAILQMADEALASVGATLWVCLDRLDVAFAEHPDLERNALRALFMVYLDLLAYDRIELKIFLRSDIWSRIIKEGFREASHITRHATIKWDRRSLMSLVAERAVRNEGLCGLYGVDPLEVRTNADAQEALFYRMCPDQVDVGPNKSKTFEWILNRTRDGSGLNAPRELIHFMNSLRTEQVRRLDTGEAMPDEGLLFARGSFKEALPEVSSVRLHQTLFAEYPALKPYLEKLKGEKTSQSAASLAALWGVTTEAAQETALQLGEVGFFEVRGDKADPEFWVPFLYRDALGMVQGSADND